MNKPNLTELKVDLGERSYEVTIGRDLLRLIGGELKSFGFSSAVTIITNPKVAGLYLDTVKASLEAAGYSVNVLMMEDGEQYKNAATVLKLWQEMAELATDRNSPIVALGGGVTGDVAGFIASSYRRGVPYIQVPTTLLSQVDSSVGGKVGFDLASGKNLIGAFYHPRQVFIDTDVLTTLERREFFAGLAEVIKYGVIWDGEFFDFLESNADSIMALDPDLLRTIIHRSCEIKAKVVSQDERELGIRAILNYGHTIGHAIETATGYDTYRHGEAIVIGFLCATKIAIALGMTGQETLERQHSILNRFGMMPKPLDSDPDKILEALWHDKKIYNKEITMILPRSIGEVEIVKNVSPELIRGSIQAISK